MDLTNKRQTPESANIELIIDRAKAYSVAIDEIDKIQNDINALDEWARDGSEQLAIAIDETVLSEIYADAHSTNKGATAGRKSQSFDLGVTGAPIALTRANILDYIVYCSSVLSENNIPKTDRFMIVPEWVLSIINTSDLRSALFTGDASNQNLRNGKVGQIANFTIYSSNVIDAVTDGAFSAWNIMFGQKSALTFATQLIKNRTMDLQNTFATVMEGLQVFGFEVIKPEALGVLYGYKG